MALLASLEPWLPGTTVLSALLASSGPATCSSPLAQIQPRPPPRHHILVPPSHCGYRCPLSCHKQLGCQPCQSCCLWAEHTGSWRSTGLRGTGWGGYDPAPHVENKVTGGSLHGAGSANEQCGSARGHGLLRRVIKRPSVSSWLRSRQGRSSGWGLRVAVWSVCTHTDVEQMGRRWCPGVGTGMAAAHTALRASPQHITDCSHPTLVQRLVFPRPHLLVWSEGWELP